MYLEKVESLNFEITQKENSVSKSGVIIRTFTRKDKKIMMKSLCKLKHKTEYWCVVWLTARQAEFDKLEWIKNLSTSSSKGMEHVDCHERPGERDL